MVASAREFLRQGCHALAAFLEPSGELNDPVFGIPAQYGTVYYAYANAALASLSSDDERGHYADAAVRGLRATLHHLLTSSSPSPAGNFTLEVGSPNFNNKHGYRDFMWLPMVRAVLLLRKIGHSSADQLTRDLERVPVPETFSERAPANWAAVWISGEWQRICAGLSPHSRDDIDEWLRPFFSDTAGLDDGFYQELKRLTKTEITWSRAIDLERGWYIEPGVPNSYDLFCRVHLLELLVEGYDGIWAEDLRRLLVSGTRRSLGVQLSTGSLANAFRSSAHLWNLTAQCWYFHYTSRLLRERDQELAAAAEVAAQRAFVAATQCLRPTGDISPVENVLPANYRVGYEAYTMDAHYVTLALGFLATAVVDGFTGDTPLPGAAKPRIHIEEEPVHRSLLHADEWSAHINLNPARSYDAFGIADVTLGPKRRLRFGGQVHFGRPDGKPGTRTLSTQMPLTLGIAVREPDGSNIRPLAAMQVTGGRFARETDAKRLEAGADLDELVYRISVEADGDILRICEDAGEHPCSLLVPYVRDCGDGYATEVDLTERSVRFAHRSEAVAVVPAGEVERVVHLPHGYEGRHGLVGLVRIDLKQPGPVSYEVRRLR